MFKFPKNQKLCSKKAIERLFEKGNNICEKPFKAVFLNETNSDDVFLKLLIIVSKKRLNKASDRNIIKRRMKEACRLQKIQLESCLKDNNIQLNLALIYQHEEILDYNLMKEKINLLLTRLIKEL